MKLRINLNKRKITDENDELINKKAKEMNDCLIEFKHKMNELMEISKDPNLTEKQKKSLDELLSDTFNLFQTNDEAKEEIFSKGGINIWVDDLGGYLQEILSLLFEMLINWISPFRLGSRGMMGKIFVHVEDKRMQIMVESLKNDKNWERKVVFYDLKSFPYTKNVECIKWSTMDKKVVRDLLGKFRVCDNKSILDQHYICDSDQNDVFHEIDRKKINTDYLEECCNEVGWDYWRQNIVIRSTKVVFGGYTKCGSITSEAFNDSRMIEYSKDVKSQQENQPKKKRGPSKGRFSIQYLKGVYPINGIGYLRINCKYRLSSNGLLSGN